MKGLNLIRTNNLTIAKLYNTVVAVIKPGAVYVSHGGYVTMSTTKAINKAFTEAGLGLKYHCYRKLGSMYITDGTNVSPVYSVNIDDKINTIP